VTVTPTPSLTAGSAVAPPAQSSSLPAGQAARLPLPTAPAVPSVSTLYNGPVSGTLECDGNPIPQNGEYVFSNLPPMKLDLVYDKNAWDVSAEENGGMQRVIIKNKRPGTQKKCTIRWKVVQ
jgi:hypothetical protein